jgi:DNA-binding CsgD family transcriptional regulator
VIALALADRGQIEAAERVLGTPVSAREHAVAGCIAWWDQRVTAAQYARRALDERGHDPIVALLAWPTLMWETDRIPARGPAALITEAAALRETVPMERSRSFLQAARLWESVAPRGQVRTMWASADAAVDADDRCAVGDLLEELAAVVAVTQIDAIAGRSTATGRRAGLPSRRGPNSDQRLTSRETDVLRLVGQGLSTPQISRRLGLAATTVNTHIRSAIIKLGSTNRRHAAATIE